MNDPASSVERAPAAPGIPARSTARRRWAVTALSVAIGAAIAGAYAYFVGCRTGTCPLTSNVWTASLYGGIVGLLAGWPSRGRRPE